MTGAGIYDTIPADRWEDAFPVGNGRHGALVLGGPREESVIVTHHLLVRPDADGPPESARPAPPELAGRLERVRDLLLAGDSAHALELFTGDWPGHSPRPFHPAFAIRLRDELTPVGVPEGYRRSLNYRTGVAAATWPGRHRICFASRARDIVVQQLVATDGAPLDLAVGIDVMLPGAPPGLHVSGRPHELAAGDVLIVTCVAYPGPGPGPGPGSGGYIGVTRVVAGPGGRVLGAPDGVRVAGGRELTLMTRVAPFSDAAELGVARVGAVVAVASLPANQHQLLTEHARRHAVAYRNVRLDLDVPPAERALPVSELLRRQAAQPDRPLPALVEKLFDSGRYLLLSASGLLPPRLTGIWQGDWNPAWAGAITSNANLGLQLAGAVTADVPAAVTAVADLVRDRLPDWRVNAQRIFGARGFAVPAHSDGRSGRCAHFEAGYPHQMWTAGADWLLVPLLDAMAACGDEEFGRERVRPAVRELAAFYEDFLTRVDSDGHVILVPSYSPENQPDGWSPAAINAVMDIAAARHALTAAAAAAADHESERRWRDLAERLPPYRINSDGALAEWAWPPAGTGLPPLPDRYDHRHVSHLYPVWPLHEITVTGTPRMAAAALRALRLRGAQDESAHGYLHKALAAARLRDAELAGRLLAALTGQGFFFRSLMSSHYPKRSVYNADAACALPAVLIEMLVDSCPPARGRPGWVELLPAVPDFLPAGKLRGVRTLTGARVDLSWNLTAGQDGQDGQGGQVGRAEAVLMCPDRLEIDVRFRQGSCRRVTLPAGQPVRVRLLPLKRFDQGALGAGNQGGSGMATLADVARHAGVATSTVSYVLSGKRSISDATRRRVQRSIELLDYHPHAGARALASSRSNVLALIVPLRGDLYVPVMMEIAIGVVTEARGFGYDVLLLTNDEGPEGIRRVMSSSRADAVILTDIGMEDDRIATIRQTGIDSVLIGVPADPAGLDCVDLDFAAAGRACLEHLAQLDHRVMAFIGEAEGVYRRHIGFAERTLRGIRAAAAGWGVDLVHRPCEGSYEAAAGVLARILEERPRTTGLIVQNEAIIPPLMSLLRTAGRTVPEDVSIVAVCPDQLAEQTSPRLTSVTLPATELGTRAVELLMRRMSDGAPGEVVLLPPVLTVRGSSAAAPKSADGLIGH